MKALRLLPGVKYALFLVIIIIRYYPNIIRDINLYLLRLFKGLQKETEMIYKLSLVFHYPDHSNLYECGK